MPFSISPYYEFSDDLPLEGSTESTTTTTTTSSTTTNGDSQELLYNGLNDKLIPIYCSILAAVVVGLVAYIVFKRSVGRKECDEKLLCGSTCQYNMVLHLSHNIIQDKEGELQCDGLYGGVR